MTTFRPISPSDFTYFRVPALPQTATGWVLLDPMPVGFCAFDTLPGLPHLADFYLLVLQSNSGSGYGTQLLKQACAVAPQHGIRQLSTLVENPKSKLAAFLKRRGFYEEHREIELSCVLPEWLAPTLSKLVQLPIAEAAPLMQRLYDGAFSGKPWYQPYEELTEISDAMEDGSRVYFMQEADESIGFVSVTITGDVAEIEPLGVVEAWQGKGFGRKLLNAMLYELKQEGVREVRLAVWDSNRAALALYDSAGFVGINTRTFLAKNL